MKKYIAVAIAVIGLGCFNASAQTATNVVTPSMTNALLGVNLPDTIFNLLPGWDKNATNSFLGNELVFKACPLWKTFAASGSTPYLSISPEYYWNKWLGLGAELTTLGNGLGDQAVDSSSAYGLARLVRGNLAPYAMLGAGYDFNRSRVQGEFGLGVEYRYTSGIGVFFDTRFVLQGTRNDETGWMTRAGVTIHF